MPKKTSNTDIKEQERAEFLQFLLEIIVEPLLFAFVVLMLFSRIQAIINLTSANPTYSFWLVLEADVIMNLGLYIGFLVVFVVWVALKGFKHRREVAEQKQLNSTLSDLQKAIKDLPDKIAEAIKSSKNEDNKSK
jgi:lipopolysaccharide export LptBFGC system permease protein LptF